MATRDAGRRLLSGRAGAVVAALATESWQLWTGGAERRERNEKTIYIASRKNRLFFWKRVIEFSWTLLCLSRELGREQSDE